MRRLLKTNELRRLELVELLSNNHSWVTIEEIAKSLNCSPRVIKDDIVILRDYSHSFNIESSYQGIRLTFDPQHTIKTFYRQVLDNSIAFKILELIFFNDGITSEEIQDALYISHSSLYRILKIMEEPLKSLFNISVDSRHCRLVGDEEAIRFFYNVYFIERYAYSEWPFTTIDEKALTDLLKITLNYIKLNVGHANFINFKFLTAVSLSRLRNNYRIDLTLEQTNLHELLIHPFDITPEFYATIKQLNIHITEDVLLQLFTLYIRQDFSLTYEGFLNKSQYNHELKRSIEALDQLLEELSITYNIPLVNKEEIILTVQNTTYNEGYLPHTAYILYNPNEELMMEIEKFSPEFIYDLTVKVQHYRQLVSKPIGHFTIEHLVYQICVRWKHLLIELNNRWSTIRALIVSDLCDGRLELVKDLLELNFGQRLELEVYDGTDLSNEFLSSLDKDLIISTSPLPTVTSLPVVCFNGDTTRRELKFFLKMINEIAEGKHATKIIK